MNAIAAARSAVADRLVTPWWYHPALGLLIAGFILALGLGGPALFFIGLLVFFPGCYALMTAYKRLTGLWISGLEAGGRAGRLAGVMGAVTGVSAVAGYLIGHETDLRWPVVVLAAIAFTATVLLGRRFDVEMRAHLRAGA